MVEYKMDRASSNNIKTWLEEIDHFNATVEEGTTRVLFTKEELGSRAYIKEEMKKLGLEVTEDAIGNIFGTLRGSHPEWAPVWTGSHIDTVLNAGMFDGMAGIVSGMEALRLIKESGLNFKRNLVVIVYTSEEPTRFGLSCLGSRAMAGAMTLDDTKLLLDEDGKSLYEVLERLGYDLSKYSEIKKEVGDVYASVELHIEQNNNLEKASLPIGIVKGICAPTLYEVTIKGCQSHAGGTSMQDRHDAFAAACELSLLLERLTKESKGEYVTGTVGRIQVLPGAVNVIPGYVKMSIDIRSIDMSSKLRVMEQLLKGKEAIEKDRGVEIIFEMENHDSPLVCDRKIIENLEKNCEVLQVPYMELISGPYHDSLFVGRFAPTAMIFVPSKNGISHSKEEWTDYQDIATGAEILAQTLLQLSNEAEQ